MVRVILPGHAPKNIYCSFDMTAGDAIRMAGGGTSPSGGGAISVNGRRAEGGSKLRPGDSVSMQPKAFHG